MWFQNSRALQYFTTEIIRIFGIDYRIGSRYLLLTDNQINLTNWISSEHNAQVQIQV